MKQYVAKTGGRYTYSDDLLNLQELALSLTSIFDGCANFIISGCEIKGSEITPGYVWINGHVRHFEGCKDAFFPYYIYEKNNYDTVTYANDVNKHGRCNYLCAGSTSQPNKADEVTGELPGFIEMQKEYSPRFIDKFFGKYAVLLETPFAKQTIKKDLTLTGLLTADKMIQSKTAVSILNPTTGYYLKNIVKASGNGSTGLYLNGLLVNEMVCMTDGSFVFYKQGKELARIDDEGFKYTAAYMEQARIGSINMFQDHITNELDNTDTGAVRINYYGYQQGGSKYRDFIVYDGRGQGKDLFTVCGSSSTVSVSSSFVVRNEGKGIQLSHGRYEKSDKKLVNLFTWTDSKKESLGWIGYDSEESFDFKVRNVIGSIVLSPTGYVNIEGELRIKGVDIARTYVTTSTFNDALKKKVDTVTGKQLSTEDFTTALKKKLEEITQDAIGDGNGFVISKDVNAALKKKLSTASNLSDLADKGAARTHLDVYSKSESRFTFLQIGNYLSEIAMMSASEIEGLSPEKVLELQAKKQENARNNIDAEKKGTGNLKLAKASNLSDVEDKAKARQNISVYSKEEIDKFLSGKIDSSDGYTGVVFTSAHKTKLEGIKTGQFAGKNAQGENVSQTEGYVMTSAVVNQLKTKANLLLDGYSAAQKTTIADNIAVYSKAAADARFGSLASSLQDYINYLTAQGKTTAQAQKTLRDKIDSPAKSDLDVYLRRDKKLADLTMANDTDRRNACKVIGAAFAADYQTKLADSGWQSCTGSNSGTLFARQIGNMVCVQGTINTGKRTGSNWGGVVAVLPNTISPPKYACRTTLCTWSDKHKYNRGSSFVISGGSRNIVLYESGWNNQVTEISFSYMT